jgi:hypothetical protein
VVDAVAPVVVVLDAVVVVEALVVVVVLDDVSPWNRNDPEAVSPAASP